MRRINDLSREAIASLEQLHRTGTSHRERVRAHAILLSARGFDLETLALVFGVDRDTASAWLDRFEQGGVQALRDADKSGRPSKITPQAQEVLRQALQSPVANFKPLVLKRLQKKGSASVGEVSHAP